MTLTTPPQTSARAGMARAGGVRSAYVRVIAADGTDTIYTVLDAISSTWTITGGERRVVSAP